jgi:hypothetical protein
MLFATDPSQSSQFVTMESIVTFGGASVVLFAATTIIHRMLGIVTIIIPLVLAMGISFAVSAEKSTLLQTPLGWVVTIGNGFLLAMSATGLNESINSATTPKPAGGTAKHGAPRAGPWYRRWFPSWLS